MHKTEIVVQVDRYECRECGEVHDTTESAEQCCLSNRYWTSVTRYVCPACKREHVFLTGAVKCCRDAEDRRR